MPARNFRAEFTFRREGESMIDLRIKYASNYWRSNASSLHLHRREILARYLNLYCGWMLRQVTAFSLLTACTLTSFHLSVMRVEPFLQGGIAVSGLFFAISSIMYGRATLSFENASRKKMAIEAAEDSFMGTLLAFAYFTTSSIIFFMLHDSGNYPAVKGSLNLSSWLPVPAAWALAFHLLLATPACVKLMAAIDKTAESWETPL